VLTDHLSKNQALCDAMAADVGGTLKTCAVVDIDENASGSQSNHNSNRVKIVVEVAGPKRASSYRKNAAAILARAITASSATGTTLVSAEAYQNSATITTTTTLVASIEGILNEHFGDAVAILADKSERKHLDAICNSGAFGEIAKGIEAFDKYEKRKREYKAWYVDNFGTEASLSTTNNGAALAFKDIHTGGSGNLDKACEEIEMIDTIKTDSNLASTIDTAWKNGMVDMPAVTVWSTLYTKGNTKENDETQKQIHNDIVSAGKVNDKFLHYCKSEGLAEHLTKCQHLEAVSGYFNGLNIPHHKMPEQFCDPTHVALHELTASEKNALCKLGKDRYFLKEATVNANYYDSLISAEDLKTLDYVVAEIGHKKSLSKAQIEFLLHADNALWGAFAGDAFEDSSKACEGVMKDFPVDIWDDEKTSEWKTHEQKLRNSRDQCYSMQHQHPSEGRKLEEAHIDWAAYKEGKLCAQLKGHTLEASTEVTQYEVMIATLNCKQDLISTVELYPNHYDKTTEEQRKTWSADKIEGKEKFPIGDLAFWADSQKGITRKSHPVIDQIEMKALIAFIDHQIKFCSAMVGVTHDQVSKLADSHKADGFDMVESAKTLTEFYKSIAPPSKSGYFMITLGEDGSHSIHPVLTFKIHVDVEVTAESKEELKMKVQQHVDMGTADDVVAHGESAAIVYDIDEQSIAHHAKGIAALMKDGLTLNDGSKAEVTSIEIPPAFAQAQKALEEAGATVSHAHGCMVNIETAELTISHPDENEVDGDETEGDVREEEAPASTEAAPASNTDSPVSIAETSDPQLPLAVEMSLEKVKESSRAFPLAVFGFSIMAILYLN